ncbi:MAG: glycosyltransferase family 39 protein [Actinomycetota bacterium]|nr:glycosyltransferase family 39 protein [Actinomycetota bacterium]MDQ2955589.1 glycosyltransferase family 39 protein [Actinomycetota bacterium]
MPSPSDTGDVAVSEDPETSEDAAIAEETDPAGEPAGELEPAGDAPADESQPTGGSRLIELLYAAGALVFLAILTGYRISVARGARHPGHADPSFTFGVAQNIHAGRGENIDYVWHFLIPGTHLNHYAFDYWLPLPSQLMAVALSVGHNRGLPAALDLNILMVVLMCLGSYALARAFTRSPWVPAVSALVVAVQPVVSRFALQSESAVYFGAFAIPAMAAAIYARQKLRWWPVAGVFAALAAMSRSEGLLLCVVIGIAALIWTENSRWYVRVGLLLAGYLPVSAPFLIQNFSHFGAPLPPSSSAFPFINSYEQLFAPHVDRSLHALFPQGLNAFIQLRASALNGEVRSAVSSLTPAVAVLCLLLAGGAAFASRAALHRRDPDRPSRPSALRSSWFVPAGFLLVVFLFDAIVAPVVSGAGATNKVMVAGVPIITVAAVVQLARARLPVAVTAFICAVLVILPLATLATDSRAVVHDNNANGDAMAALIPILKAEQACLNRPLVLMTRSPWEFNQVTGYPAVQLPDGSQADILKIAAQYGVTDIENPGLRASMRNTTTSLGAGGPLIQPATLTGRNIYRIKSTTAGARC